MWRYCLSLFLVVMLTCAMGQDECRYRVEVKVVDKSSGRALSDAFVVFRSERGRGPGKLTDKEGVAVFKGLCEGHYHLSITHFGCSPFDGFFLIRSDTSFTAMLSHSVIELPEVLITDNRRSLEEVRMKAIRTEIRERQQFKPIADIATSVPGVQVLRTGGNISKPIIRGMNAQRIAVLNHGMVQAGQQWGNDHAPEISAFIYDSILVVRGISPVHLPAGHLGGAMLAGKSSAFADSHWHGSYAAGFETNGRGHWQHLRLDKGFADAGGIRLDAAFKRSGDMHTPNYYMRNTGMQEWSAGLLWKKNFTPVWNTVLNVDFYRTEIGILRGAHIGNVEDLKEAMSREIPFFTRDEFSYHIDLPRQEVMHLTLSSKTKIHLRNQSEVQVDLGAQINDRKEFDFRRSGENDRPALSLYQWLAFGEVKYSKNFNQLGIQYSITDNTNLPGTGILPLIPDYLSHRASLYYSGQKKLWQKEVSWGLRYDRVYYQAFPIVRSIPLEVLEDVRYYGGFTLNSTINLIQRKNFRLDYEVQLTNRIPEINELFSFGLHQGVAGIEEGNSELRREKAFQQHVNSLVHIGKVTVRADAYGYLFGDFINLEPTGELRSTIRGAFPVFAYRQYDRSLVAGADAIAEYQITEQVGLEIKSAVLYAHHLSEQKPIAWMPANRAEAGFRIKLPEVQRVKSGEWRIHVLMVDRQRRIFENQDFMPPPPGYVLFHTGVDFSIPLKKNYIAVSILMENALNKRYRDFLNRWKYFSDETGINISVSLRYKF
ncbi:TonB-dependent receptor plug domain-containing protein [Schleiferia thermophila]|jgi:iron complex outermembrane receptor protein|nr:TonB-dependent receptor plug domain-containing protein [Schleiferia thermophila]